MDMKEKLVELFYDNNVRCDQKIEGLADDVMDIIANGVTVQEWISVKKKCPRLRERKYYTVPTFDGTHEYTSSGFVIGLAENKPVIVEYCEEDVFAPWRDKAGYRSWFDKNGKKQDVTHWMPLPQLPKGE